MPKKTITKPVDFEETIMAKVTSKEISMKPRWYFVAGSFLVMVGLVSASIAAAFFFNLTLFLARSHGPMADVRLQQIVAQFPWWVPFMAVASIVAGVVFLRRYDFSYKNNFWLILAGFVTAILIAAFIVDSSGLNDTWSRRGPMRGLYQHFEGQKGFRKQQDRRDTMFRPASRY